MIDPATTPLQKQHALNLLLLTCASGVLDGLSFLRSHVFTANMTGNTVLLGIHFFQGDTGDALKSLLALISWAVGCLIAAAVLLGREQRGGNAMRIGFTVELVLLILFGIFFPWHPNSGKYLLELTLICCGAVSLSIQSVVVRDLKVAGVATTFITGTVTSAMVGMVRLIRRSNPPGKAQEEHILLLLAMPLVYLGGAICAAVLSTRAQLIIGFIPAAIVAIVLLRTR